MSALLPQLQTFTNRVRRALVVERVSQAMAVLLTATLALVLLDFALRLPPLVRAVELVMLGAWAVLWVIRQVVPAIRFNPPLVEVALRLERNHTEGAGIVASGAEFAQSGEASPWARQTVDAAAQAMPSLMERRIDRSAVRRALLGAVAAAALCTSLMMFAPDSAVIGLKRLFTPFSSVQWPARTMVESGMVARVHPRGAALALRALALRGDPATMRVTADFRLVRNGTGEWKSVVLAPQPDGSFERLVETDGDSLQVVFSTTDMETDPVRVDLVRPPQVVDAHVTVRPPAYAQGDVDARRADLGPGTDRRAVLSPPVLEGSQVELTVTLDDANRPPAAGPARDAFVARALRLSGAGGTVIAPEFEFDESTPNRWVLRWTSSGPGVLELSPEGREGIRPAERIAYEIPSAPDQAPTIAITDPPSDETVTDSATPFVVVEGRDDLRVSKVWLEAVR
ncbi:MAG: hypothetical protein JNK53_07150, partial [Phycisphaerae bacterium]|nr:hypothetical protein [Phycisphaerae bacterium]